MGDAKGSAIRAAAALLFLASPLFAQPSPGIRFDRLSIDQGLSQATVLCVLQDRHGFMWFGTEDGLNRYDGYTFTVFKHDESDAASLSHNFVSALLEDHDGLLWVGTRMGLNRFDPLTERFQRFRNDPSDPSSLSQDRIRVIGEDTDGEIWIGTEGGGLDRFDRGAGSFVRFNHDPSNAASLGHDDVTALLQDRHGDLWIGTGGGGLDRFDRRRSSFVHHRRAESDPRSLSDDNVTALLEDRAGVLWVGTGSGGLNLLERSQGGFERRRVDPDSPALSASRVRAMLEDDGGRVWIATDAGLAATDSSRHAFRHYRNDAADARSLSDDQVSALFEDRGGVLWVGTGTGISKFNTRIVPFASVKATVGRTTTPGPGSGPLGLSYPIVTAFCADALGQLWVGTFGGGLDRMDRRSGIFTYFRHQPSDPTSLADDRVTALDCREPGAVWVGTFARGLDRFDGRRFAHHRQDPSDPRSLSFNGVSSLLRDAQGILWIGTFGGGLDRAEGSGAFVHYRHRPGESSSLNDDRVRPILEDRDGILWVGTDAGGLSRFDRSTRRFTSFRHDPADPRSLSSNAIYSLHEDANGVLWIGTDAGLNRWDRADRLANRGRFRRLGKPDGLPHEMVYGILSDRAGNIWLSTLKGLSRLDPRSGQFKNYNPSHGLQSYEFNFGAAYQDGGGEMFFGGVNGFNVFRPETIRENSYRPPVVPTALWKSGQPVRLDRALWSVKEINLGHHDYGVSLEFAALDYTAPEQNRYAYQLEGLDGNWTDLGTARRVSYTNLAPGRYVLRVKGSNNDGLWNEEGLALRIRVIPPPWRTWWAYALYLAAAAAVVGTYVRSQSRKLAREEQYSRKLEQQVRERTRELEERSLQLAEGNDELQLLNTRLEEASLTDPVTGLRNRRYLMSHIQEDLALVERYYAAPRSEAERRSSKPPDFLFLMIDLDGFKQVNDDFGHDAGDRVLLQVSERLGLACRKSDTLIRWGGDEFLIVGRGVDRGHAELVAERVRRAIAEQPFDLGEQRTVRLGCCIGFAFYPFLPSDITLLKGPQVVTVADRALYLAKASGRNAWVGILATETSPREELLRQLNGDLERLVGAGAIELSTSIQDSTRLVWNRP